MFAKCDALPKRDLCDVFVQGIHSRYSSWVFQASTPYQKQVPESSSTLHQFYIMLASFPSFRCSWRKKPVSRREAEGLVTELSSPRFVRYNTVIVSKIWITGYWLRSQLWHVTDANQWTVVKIEFLAKVGWKRGCLSAAHVRKMWCTAEKRFMRHVCLMNPFPLFLLGIPGILHYACIIPIPSL